MMHFYGCFFTQYINISISRLYEVNICQHRSAPLLPDFLKCHLSGSQIKWFWRISWFHDFHFREVCVWEVILLAFFFFFCICITTSPYIQNVTVKGRDHRPFHLFERAPSNFVVSPQYNDNKDYSIVSCSKMVYPSLESGNLERWAPRKWRAYKRTYNWNILFY